MSIDPLDESSRLNVLAIPSYNYLEQGSKKFRIALQNNSREVVKLKKGMTVAKIMSANVAPLALASKINDEKDGLEPLSERLTKLFDKLDLSDISEWTQKNQDYVYTLMKENQHLFALNDLEFGKTSFSETSHKTGQPSTF